MSSPEPSSKKPKDSSSKKRKPHTEIAVDLSLPEPPSKKARRAVKKGKPLPPSSTKNNTGSKPTASDGDGDVDKPADGKEESKKRSDHSVWIGNLTFTTTRESLAAFLVASSGGSIAESSVTRVKIPAHKSAAKGQGIHPSRAGNMGNKGFAYVDFDNASAMYAAIALSESELEGRKLLIKAANNFEGRPAVTKPDGDADGGDGTTGPHGKSGAANTGKKGATTGTGSKKIFIGNLPYQVTDDDLRNHFDKCGEINWVKVATFEDSGKCKGYAWVSFREEEGALSAVRGFVKVPEEELEVEDFEDDDTTVGKAEDEDEDEDEEDESDGEKKAPKKIKMRKWWLNRIMGRDLKIEMAEDDQTRYSKRFRKGGRKEGESTGEGRGEGRGGQAQRKKKEAFAEEKVYAENGDSYRTGGIVEAKGKKITFD